ncbi:MAG TPA: glycosyltransferase [Chitinophagaceae bacterium]|nr:glycosyltransferase [Chitinophagaceae bacterium]
MKHILWLASWYPDEISPYNGDFIQRHARAVALHLPLTVVYVAQHGPEVEMPETKVVTHTEGNLTEIIVYFRHRKGEGLLQRLRYNWKYFYHFRRYMRQYLAQRGRPDLVHVHIPMKAGRMALWIRQKFGIPFIVTEHSSAYFPEVPDSYHRRNAYYRRSVADIFRAAAAVTTVSQQLGNRLKEVFGIRNMHIITNVADTRFFHYREVKPPLFRFLHASTMNHPKNVEGILRALKELKALRADWECVMLGWDTPALRAMSSALGLDGHVIWKGVVSYRQVAAEMQQASVLLVFSRYESQGCVILEALCCGLPVIATRVGGIPEIVQEHNTILVESENEQQLLEAMVRSMDQYAQFDRPAIARESQERFSYETVGKQFADLYNHLYDERNG